MLGPLLLPACKRSPATSLDRLVNIGGISLQIHCVGEGQPWSSLESGDCKRRDSPGMLGLATARIGAPEPRCGEQGMELSGHLLVGVRPERGCAAPDLPQHLVPHDASISEAGMDPPFYAIEGRGARRPCARNAFRRVRQSRTIARYARG
jgi:hypothetical protein